MRTRWILILLLALAAVAGLSAFVFWRARHPCPTDPLTAGTSPDVVVLDAEKPVPVDPPPAGWWHRKFLFTPPMAISFGAKDTVPALRCETNGSGSIFGRFTDLAIDQRPILTWRWFVEAPVTSELDERTEEGDDHPVRLFLTFRDSEREDHSMEIIWSNRIFKRGDWKYINGFAHYVADAGNENTGSWRDERVDLAELYRYFTKRNDAPTLTYLAVFCDTDQTGGHSVAYTSSIRLSAR